MKFVFSCLIVALGFSLHAQSVKVPFNEPLPGGWAVISQAQTTNADGTIRDIIVLSNSEKRMRMQIGIVQKEEPFDLACSSWKKSALNMASQKGLSLSDIKFETRPYHSEKQALLSFQASKGGLVIFMTSRFRLEKGKQIAVAASSSNDIRQDESVFKIFDSISP